MRISQLIRKIHYYITILDQSDSGYRFRVINYNSLIDKIKCQFLAGQEVNYAGLIKEIDISDRMKGNLKKIMKLRVPAESADEKKKRIIAELAQVNGIGAVKAKELYSAGVRSIADLLKQKNYLKLSEEAKLFVALKPLRRIPYEFIKSIEAELKSTILKGIKFIIVGSYRRKRPKSGDIDIMITRSSLDLIKKRLDKPHRVFTFFPYSSGSDKISSVCVVNAIKEGKKVSIPVKLDFFRTNAKEEPFMLVYSTGSKKNNLKMRRAAIRLGLTMNQKGFYKNASSEANSSSKSKSKNKKKTRITDSEINKKLGTKGKITERKIYNYLGLTYLEPHQRE